MLYIPVVDKEGKPLVPIKRQFWSKEDDDILRNLYGKAPYCEIRLKFPHRNRNGIKGRAKNLGLIGNKSSVMSLAKKKYHIHQDYFFVPNIENSYWAGFIAADGCLSSERNSVKIQLQAQDFDHLELFALMSGYDGKIKLCGGGSFKSASKQAVINICGVHNWIKDLEKNFNITQRKSLTLIPPEDLDDDCSAAFVIGYIDGDGTIGITHNKYKSTIYNSSYISVRGTLPILSYVKSVFDRIVAPSKQHNGINIWNGYAQYRVSGKRAIEIIHEFKKYKTPKLTRKWT